MHRMPIKLNEPSYTWDRGVPDYVLFEKALNAANVNDMMKTIERIDYEINAFERFRNMSAINDYNNALDMLHRQDEKSALLMLQKVILQGPKEGFALQMALRMRGNIFYKQNRFDGAANDFELLLYLTCYVLDNILEIYAKLFICYYMLGKYDKARETYELYNCQQPKSEKGSTKGSKLSTLDFETEMLTSTVRKLYMEIEHQHTTPSPIKKESYTPVFWTSLVSEYKGVGVNRLYSSSNLPANTMVLQEKPAVRVLGQPWIQCDYCLEITENVYTCFDCRVQTYCGIECLQRDYLHEEECNGVKYLIVLMLNAQQLFKAFVDLTFLIKRHLLVESGLVRLKTAREVLIAIRLCARDFNIPLLRLLAQECDYTDLSDMEFSTVITTTVRLAVFIVEKTNILNDFRHATDLSSKQELILVGSLLMQLQYYLQHGSYLISYDIPVKRAKVLENTLQLEEKMRLIGLQISPKENYQSVREFYYFNEDALALEVRANLKDLERELPKRPPSTSTRPSQSSASQVESLVVPMLEYCDFVARTVLQDEFAGYNGCMQELSRYIARMDYSTQTVFLNSYIKQFIRSFQEFFMRKRTGTEDRPAKQIIMLLGRDLQKFRHSCDPNVEIIFLTNGYVMGKTLKPVRKGEECFVSFRTRFFTDDLERRMSILKQYNAYCECIYCRMPSKSIKYAMHSNIYCVSSCKREFRFADEVCPKCGRDYNSILQRYAEKLADLETGCNMADDRTIHKHWIVLDKLSEQLFPSYHEYRIMQKLKYAKFVAMNNFFTQAYDLARSVYADIRKYYAEESVLFTFYPPLIEIFTLLQYYNLDRGLKSASIYKLREINKLGISLIHAQLTNLRIYEKFDQNAGTILFNYRLFCKWKELMIILELDVEGIEQLLPEETRIPGLEKNR